MAGDISSGSQDAGHSGDRYGPWSHLGLVAVARLAMDCGRAHDPRQLALYADCAATDQLGTLGVDAGPGRSQKSRPDRAVGLLACRDRKSVVSGTSGDLEGRPGWR